MVTLVDASALYQTCGGEKSAIRKFAEESLQEFMRISKPGDVAAVTDSPDTGVAEHRRAAQLIGALKTEKRHQGLCDDVDVFQRHGMAFLRRRSTPL